MYGLDINTLADDKNIQEIFMVCQNIFAALAELESIMVRYSYQDIGDFMLDETAEIALQIESFGIRKFIDEVFTQIGTFTKETTQKEWDELVMKVSLMCNAISSALSTRFY